MSTLKDRMDKLPPAWRNKVEVRSKELIAEELSLRDLRKARKVTRAQVAEKLRINKENSYRLERHCDLLISTIRGLCRGDGLETEPRGGVSGSAADGDDRHRGTRRSCGAF